MWTQFKNNVRSIHTFNLDTFIKLGIRDFHAFRFDSIVLGYITIYFGAALT